MGKTSCLVIFLAAVIAGFILAPCESGSPCPTRGELYPCMCTSVPISKKQIYTIVTCRHIPNTATLTSIFGALRNMRIDRFIIYDSFWETKNLPDKDKDTQGKLPQNFLSMLMIRELEIHDSELSSCFACDSQACPNRYLHVMSIYNSSSASDACSTCNMKLFWTGCIPDLKRFDFSGNKIKSIDNYFFFRPMQKLTHLNFSHNEISTVGNDTFKNMPSLVSLDLSHNKISDLSLYIFAPDSSLTHLDLSYNIIMKLSSNVFKFTPNLKTLLATNNLIKKVQFTDWKHMSKKIQVVDLSGNPLHCDCHMIWINCTTKAHVQFLGYCSNEGFDQTPLRRVSRYVSERCVNDQLMDKRRNKTEPNGCHEFLLKQKETVQLLELNRVAPNRRDRKPVVTQKPK